MAGRQTRTKRRPKVGDRVRFKWGTATVGGVIVEDRGCIGVGGRRLLLIRAHLDEFSEIMLELPVDELLVA